MRPADVQTVALSGDVDANGELVDRAQLDVELRERLRRAIGSGHAASVDVEEHLDRTLRLRRGAGVGA